MTDWKPTFREMGAVFERPRDAGAEVGHIDTMKSDIHSSAYFNSDFAEQYIDTMDEIGVEMARILLQNGIVPDRIVGHAPFAEIPAASLARGFRVVAGLNVLVAYSRLRGQGRYETSFPIKPGEKDLLVADDVVSGKSTVETGLDLRSKGGVILPVVPCLANLSLRSELVLAPGEEGLPFLAASTFEPERYRKREEPCRMCELGSVALAPREGNNWGVLQSQL